MKHVENDWLLHMKAGMGGKGGVQTTTLKDDVSIPLFIAPQRDGPFART